MFFRGFQIDEMRLFWILFDFDQQPLASFRNGQSRRIPSKKFNQNFSNFSNSHKNQKNLGQSSEKTDLGSRSLFKEKNVQGKKKKHKSANLLTKKNFFKQLL
jgi:hypothetical protein